MRHHAKDIVNEGTWKFSTTAPVVGLDIGSRGSKGVLLNGDEVITVLLPTGLYMQETADELLTKLLQTSDLVRSDIKFVVGTGYGRISLAYDDIPYKVVTEISCHAMGAHAVNPKTRTIIDIGGQDSKAIKVDTATGKVVEFVMNDKCAAGTGRFLEKAAAILGIDLRDLGEVALRSKNPAPRARGTRAPGRDQCGHCRRRPLLDGPSCAQSAGPNRHRAGYRVHRWGVQQRWHVEGSARGDRR
jgi:activator of 2-hydroxyglutaryl-CoA dehydratase